MRRAGRTFPQSLHLLARGARTHFLCGVTKGETTRGFVRLNDEGIAWLKKALRDGAKLCAGCEKIHEAEGAKT